MSIMSFMMRMGCKKSDAKRDEGLVYPDDVIRIEDISYGPHKMNVLDVENVLIYVQQKLLKWSIKSQL